MNTAPDLKIQAEVIASINRRRARARAEEREQIEKEILARQEQEDAKQLKREADAEAGVATFIDALTATISMDFYDRRFTINLAHRDTAIRDIAISAMQRLAIFVTREIQGAVTLAANIGKAGGTVPTGPSDPQWVEK